MRAILIHGMGRTPLSMLILAARLRRRGLRPALFAYAAALESLPRCADRLQRYIERTSTDSAYVLVGHSLGTVLIRHLYPQLRSPPAACYFIAPPGTACRAARAMAPRRLFKLATGEMGQLLANPLFMRALAVPDCPTRIYAGVGGPVGRFSPFGDELNDGVLSLREATIAGLPVTAVRRIHTFAMNARVIADDIAADVRRGNR